MTHLIRTWRRPGALLAAALVAAVGLGAAPASAGTTVPYTDPSAAGYIGLCDAAGHQILSGNTATTPVAWRAVSSEAATAPYDGPSRTAVLLAYQPRPGLSSGEWSGEALTASSRYTNPAHPMVAATGADESLGDYLQDYPTAWDGFVELRIYLGASNAEVDSYHYPALDLQVTGTTWHAVGGGPVDCRSGTAESLETVVLPASATASPTTRPGAVAVPVPKVASRPSSSSSRSHGPLAVGAVLVVLVLLLGGLLLARHRGAHNSSTGAAARRPSTKGLRP